MKTTRAVRGALAAVAPQGGKLTLGRRSRKLAARTSERGARKSRNMTDSATSDYYSAIEARGQFSPSTTPDLGGRAYCRKRLLVVRGRDNLTTCHEQLLEECVQHKYSVHSPPNAFVDLPEEFSNYSSTPV